MSGEERRQRREPIAVIGMGCRLPGASSPAEFWELLVSGGNAVREIPPHRFDLDALYDPTPATPGHISTRWAGIVDGLDTLDAQFFGIAPREAEMLDPQQRLLLETAWEAFEDAGIPADRVAGSDTGVFMGVVFDDYEARMGRDQASINFHMTLGTTRSAASGRLSFFFGLQGPSVTVDSACSSSLLAVHLACRSLWSGESRLALAGGANTILEPFVTIAYSQSRIMAPDGRCKFGDASADGYVRSDGAAVVVLKRLSDAEAAGDPIHAVILGGAVNNDGRGSGFLATPSLEGQEQLLRKAYLDAGVPPGLAQYIEAHGTGTLAGDPVEIGALGAVLGEGRRSGGICRIGSVKTNIGHTEGAAGVSGLLKVVLALKHGRIPKSLHFNEPNPRIPWDALPVAVQTDTTEWPEGWDGAIAGVNATGISGTNAHLVLQAYSRPRDGRRTAVPPVDRPRVLPLSAQTAEALAETARAWAAYLRRSEPPVEAFRDVCYTAAARRSHHEHRLTVVAHGHEEAAEQLDAYLAGEPRPYLVAGRRVADSQPKVVFVFPGQGSQWLGMGRGLLQTEPAFAEALARCDAAVRALTGWSVLDELHADEATSRLARIDVVQPVLFSIQVALAALWRSWGIEPNAVVGHSMGEIAAAHVAGALTLEDAARVICRRSVLLRRTSGKGAMAVVELSLQDAYAALTGREDRLSVAVSNSPRSTVLSGDPDALDEVLAALEAREVFCRRVNVDVASHSPQMDPLRGDLLDALDGLRPRTAAVAFHSTVYGTGLDGTELDAAYWVRNLREPVLFAPTVKALIGTGHTAFVEMSPHPLLVGAVQEMLRDVATDGLALPSLRREENEPAVILASLGAVHANGSAVEWQRLFEDECVCVAVPTYQWQRERFWYDGPDASRRSNMNDLLGDPFRPAEQPHSTYWEFDLSVEALPSLADHCVRGAVVVPAALFAELALEAGTRRFGAGRLALKEVVLSAALVLPAGGAQRVQIIMTAGAPDSARVRILSRRPGDEAASDPWVEHVAGTIQAIRQEADAPVLVEPAAALQARSAHLIDSRAHYAALAARGLPYGPSYQRVEDVWRSDDVLLARLSRPAPPPGIASPLQARAALLDACFQVLGAALPVGADGDGRGDTYVPTGIRRLTVHGRPESDALWCHVTNWRVTSPAGDPETFEGDVILADDSGRALIEARGLRLFRLERERDAKLRAALHRLEWIAAPAVDRPAPPPGTWLVVEGSSPESAVVSEGLRGRGARVVVVRTGGDFQQRGTDEFIVRDDRPDDIAAVLTAVPDVRGIAEASTIGENDPVACTGTVLSLGIVQAVVASGSSAVPRLWLVTCGSQAVTQFEPVPCLSGSALWGLRSVIAAEHPEIRCSALDFGGPEDGASLVDELLAGSVEDQVALRGGRRLIQRLRQGAPEGQALAAPARPAAGRPYRVVTSSPGILDALAAEETPRRDPKDDEVEIEVCAVGLNFMNVMSALGACPGYPRGLGPLGVECAGQVARIGRHVSRFAPGDAVMSFAFDSLATHTVASEHLVARVPSGLTMTEAATIPVAFLTSYYALHYLARLAPGDRVLIHSAMGGVGLAALQLARAAGADVFATAGTEEKRRWLRAHGARYAGDSRSLAFADEIRAATGGEGIDIVLNSLAGDAIPASLSLLRVGGRFLELGKRDIYEDRAVGLGAFRRNVSYFAIDLDAMARHRSAEVGAVLQACMTRFEEARLEPLPAEVFPVARVADAFRRMAQGTHTGKLVVAIDPVTAPVRPPATARPRNWADGAYLITGGTGGVGLEIATWMVSQGARDIVLMSRRGEDADVAPLLQPIRDRGARVIVAAGDVAREEDVAAMLHDIGARGMTLRGVVHAAAVLDDATLLQLDETKLRRVFAPKVLGAWHLHRLTASAPLDFFVLFSSVAAFLGSAGQANYAAANAWIDALAAERRARGLPAISISWGPWAAVGLAAARSDRGERMAARGLGSFSPQFGVTAFGELLERNPIQAAVMPFDYERWSEVDPAAGRWPLFTELAGAVRTGTPGSPMTAAGSLREALLSVPAGRLRRARLEECLQQQLAQVLKLAPSRIDVSRPLRAMGLDSLMALELRNRLEAQTTVSVPVTMIWNYPTISLLATQLAVRMAIGLDEADAAAPDVVSGASAAEEEQTFEALLQELEGLSDDDTRRLLAEEL